LESQSSCSAAVACWGYDV